MSTDSPCLTWEEALREFLLHLQATRAKQTARCYQVQLGRLGAWCRDNDVPLAGFGKRHLDRYLVSRSAEGKAPLTLHHDAICAKAFLRWCAKNDILERSLLAEYEIRRAPAQEKQIVIRESKGREPRTLPVSPEWVEAVSVWLKVRARVMAAVPKEEDEGWLFISEFGGRLDEGRFLKAVRRILEWVGLTDAITLHSLRRYSLNRLEGEPPGRAADRRAQGDEDHASLHAARPRLRAGGA